MACNKPYGELEGSGMALHELEGLARAAGKSE
jgi:hypothetical protein